MFVFYAAYFLKKKRLSQFSSTKMQFKLIERWSTSKRFWKKVLILIALTALILSILQPQYGLSFKKTTRRGQDNNEDNNEDSNKDKDKSKNQNNDEKQNNQTGAQQQQRKTASEENVERILNALEQKEKDARKRFLLRQVRNAAPVDKDW